MATEKDRGTPHGRQPGKIRVDYFKQPHPFRTLKRRLTLACALLAGGWIVYAALAGEEGIYSPGPVAAVHSPIEPRCTLCHTGSPGSLWRSVTDQACRQCHAGPVHHANQVFAGVTGSQPSCSFCHVEHGGRTARLTRMDDGFCTQCHESLTTDPASAIRFAVSVTRFDTDHPEFRLIAEKSPDKTPLKLNHEKHLRPDLPGPQGTRVQMVCSDCHRTDGAGQMMPIQFERDCQACHSLAFDEIIPEEAPHEAPEYVEAFVRTAFSKYAGNNPGEWKKDPNWHPARNIASLRRMLDEAPKNLPEWVESRFAVSRRLLLERKCLECHDAQITPPQIPARWFVHSEFSHKPHQIFECASCHAGAAASASTSDLLLPGREACTACHNRSNDNLIRCTTCHAYHPADVPAFNNRVKLPN
jgi:predicted CXXCH cytochrome family protein